MISSGVSGIVQRLPSGDAIKSPWPGIREDDSRRDMTTEAQIYTRLGPHPRLVKIINWDPEECNLIMEYMSNGSLMEYLRENNDSISAAQRIQWVLQAAEGLQVVHSANVMHCDVSPTNFLLGADLDLRIADFAGSSFDGSKPTTCSGPRFAPLGFKFFRNPPTVQEDLYALSSTIYTIMTGHFPFQEVPSDDFEEHHKAHGFPDVTGIPCGETIKRCWLGEFASAQEIYHSIQVEIKQPVSFAICALSPMIIHAFSNRKLEKSQRHTRAQTNIDL